MFHPRARRPCPCPAVSGEEIRCSSDQYIGTTHSLSDRKRVCDAKGGKPSNAVRRFEAGWVDCKAIARKKKGN